MSNEIEITPHFRADLHCHSTCSDGSMQPREIVQEAILKNLKGLAISDHDTINAYPQVLDYAQQAGIEMISAVEFSSFHQELSIHLLGYSFATSSIDIRNFCLEHQKRREKRALEILSLLKKNHMLITEEELYKNRDTKHGIGRPHIAQAMVEKGYVNSVSDAFKKYIGDGKPCFTSGNPYSIEETMACIHQANGFCVLAHPHLINSKKVLQSLLEMPFDGIECCYARFPKEENHRWLKIAASKGWLALGGSDFHGTVKPQIQLGCSWTREETFRILQKRFNDNQYDSRLISQ